MAELGYRGPTQFVLPAQFVGKSDLEIQTGIFITTPSHRPAITPQEDDIFQARFLGRSDQYSQRFFYYLYPSPPPSPHSLSLISHRFNLEIVGTFIQNRLDRLQYLARGHNMSQGQYELYLNIKRKNSKISPHLIIFSFVPPKNFNFLFVRSNCSFSYLILEFFWQAKLLF